MHDHGGANGGYLYSAIIHEELARIRAHALMVSLHSDICMPYLTAFGNEEQKRRFLPGTISGEILLAIAMTEPDTGSDLANIQTRAVRDGNHYVLNQEGKFLKERHHKVPIEVPVVTLSLSFGDVDLDGDLDAILGNWSFGVGRDYPVSSAIVRKVCLSAPKLLLDCLIPNFV